jgi:amino acid adenylation domain-containing protein
MTHDGPMTTDEPTSLLRPGQIQEVLAHSRGPACPYPTEEGIHRAIAMQACRTPDRTAVVFRERALTFAELDAQAERLARRLAPKPLAPDTVIGLCLDRSLDMVIGALGILKAGAAYLPLDPAFPPDRLDYMLQDSGATSLVTTDRLLGHFPRPPAAVVCLDPGWDRTAESPGAQGDGGGGNAAYLIYTSGSTGRPKGVLVEHRQVANFFVAMDRLLGARAGVWLAVTSISFDISVLELFWTLARGWTVIVQGEAEMFAPYNPHALLVQIRRHHVTHLQCTPSLARLMAAHPETAAALGGLKALLVGGEALPLALARRLRGLCGGELFNMYGPTETTVWSTVHRVRATDDVIPIGRPLANTSALVLDEAQRLVPPGLSGELYIGGAGVVRGYHRRPALTAARFVPDPFQAGGARLYRTGDRVRMRPDGTLEFLGRLDNQVKVLGHRIEPEEIEAVLGQHPAVRAAIVMAERQAGEQRLVAYVVMDETADAAGELGRYLEQRLPAYMLPAKFVLLSTLPTTPNGKVDRAALPALGHREPATPADPIPRSLREVLAGIWRETMEGRVVPLDQNFFDMGATSLDVVAVAMRLSTLLGREVPITDLFAYPTIRALADHLASQGEPSAGSEAGSVRGHTRRETVTRLRGREAGRATSGHPSPLGQP